jgi:ketosteroid isomerase-like protein
MPQPNVEVAEALVEAWNAGDMDGVRHLFAPDVVVRTPEDWPEPGPYVGPDAVMRQLEQNRAAWDADMIEPITDFIGVADRVIGHYVWRGAGRGPATEFELTLVATVRNGKILGLEFFWNHAEALEAVGLSEQDAPAGS